MPRFSLYVSYGDVSEQDVWLYCPGTKCVYVVHAENGEDPSVRYLQYECNMPYVMLRPSAIATTTTTQLLNRTSLCCHNWDKDRHW